MDRKHAASSYLSSSVVPNKRCSYLSQQQRVRARVTAKQQLQRLISSAPTRATSEHKTSATARVFPSSVRLCEKTKKGESLTLTRLINGYGDAHQLMSMRGVGIAMQQMHQSYKCMKAQQKKLSGCASNLLAHEDLGHFEEAHHWNIQAKFYNENSHQYMKVITQETLYMKNMVLL